MGKVDDDGASDEPGRGCDTSQDHDWIVVTYGARIIAPEFPVDTVRMCRKCGTYEIT
jgi:hypothetical protein